MISLCFMRNLHLHSTKRRRAHFISFVYYRRPNWHLTEHLQTKCLQVYKLDTVVECFLAQRYNFKGVSVCTTGAFSFKSATLKVQRRPTRPSMSFRISLPFIAFLAFYNNWNNYKSCALGRLL